MINDTFDELINKLLVIHEKSQFELGELMISKVARVAYEAHQIDITDFLYRHATGDFGNVQQCELTSNTDALNKGKGNILSRYALMLNDGSSIDFNIVTSSDRSLTSVLLPHELNSFLRLY